MVFRHFRKKCLGINSSPSGSNNFPSPQYPLVKVIRDIRKIDCDVDDLNIWLFTGNDMRMILGRRKDGKVIDVVYMKSYVLHKYWATALKKIAHPYNSGFDQCDEVSF